MSTIICQKRPSTYNNEDYGIPIIRIGSFTIMVWGAHDLLLVPSDFEKSPHADNFRQSSGSLLQVRLKLPCNNRPPTSGYLRPTLNAHYSRLWKVATWMQDYFCWLSCFLWFVLKGLTCSNFLASTVQQAGVQLVSLQHSCLPQP